MELWDASAQLTSKSDPGVVIADSSLEWKIKDAQRLLGKVMLSEEILLMEYPAVFWKVFQTIEINNENEDLDFEFLPETMFCADVKGFPDELKRKCEVKFTVSIDDQIVSSYDSATETDLKIECSASRLGIYCKNNSITLKFHLVITSEGGSSLRHKFYDPKVTRKFLSESVAKMLEDPTFADFTFIVCGKEFKVHMNILAAASPVMRRMFIADLEAKTKKCTIDAIDPEIFAHLLLFIYNCVIPENLKAIAKPLYEAAHYYEIENLKKICGQEIHESLSPGNALEVFEWVQLYDFEDLKTDAWTIIKRDILKIFVEFQIEPLSLEQTKSMIKQRKQNKEFSKMLEEVPKKDGRNLKSRKPLGKQCFLN